ncbi:Tn3 family transposase [Streptomyces sp. URMC 126]|uniref:Tn3 family transposase n=1 Tax=Streptomyces sp. URMC 126 TaxID=3423401 RepID=UPI003F1D3EB6
MRAYDRLRLFVRALCHGGRARIRQAHREGQGDRLAALGLVLNAVVLRNTRYQGAAVARLRPGDTTSRGAKMSPVSSLSRGGTFARACAVSGTRTLPKTARAGRRRGPEDGEDREVEGPGLGRRPGRGPGRGPGGLLSRPASRPACRPAGAGRTSGPTSGREGRRPTTTR